MKILVFNIGSTSLRFKYIDSINSVVLASGGLESIKTKNSTFKYENLKGRNLNYHICVDSYNQALNLIIDTLFDVEIGVISSIKDIEGIGHRVVHGGAKYIKATLIDSSVLDDINRFSSIAPLHNKNAVELIRACQKKFKNTKNVAVFDTAFHSTIPAENYLYALPKEYYLKYGIRKYGFHGISYSYVLDRFSQMIIRNKNDINTVICHLGGGCSMCAIKNGKSFDTTMGFSPLSGMIMPSRSGNIDPTIIPFLMEKEDLNPKDIENILNYSSGYLAICDEYDSKKIVEKSNQGDISSIILRKMINRDFKKNLLAMMSNLTEIDSVIMTGGISAKNREQRELCLSELNLFGLELDIDFNNIIWDSEGIISKKDSKIPIYVIPTDEEKEIANQAVKILRR